MENKEVEKLNLEAWADIFEDLPDYNEDVFEGEEHVNTCCGCMDCLGLSWRDFL